MSISRTLNKKNDTLFLDFASLDRNDLDLHSLRVIAASLDCFPQTRPEQLDSRNPEAWCVIVNKVRLDREFFKRRPALRLVCIAATGTNNVDLKAAAEHGVAVVNCQSYGTDTVAQHTIMLMLALVRNLPRYHQDVISGKWSASSLFCLLDYPLRELGELRLGIIGYGDVGRRVGQLAQAFGMDVVVAERHTASAAREGRVDFEEVVRTSDVISLHCPLDDASRHFINEKIFRAMRSDAYLINTARGGLVDETALLCALKEGWIAGAAVDVLEEEPPTASNALITAGLENLIITPHCAWGSRRARQAIVEQIAENIAAFLNGENLRRVV